MDDDRKYDCVRYRRCLAAAARRNAPGLPCDDCQRYRRAAGLSPRELQGCTELLGALFGDPAIRRNRAQRAVSEGPAGQWRGRQTGRRPSSVA